MCQTRPTRDRPERRVRLLLQRCATTTTRSAMPALKSIRADSVGTKGRCVGARHLFNGGPRGIIAAPVPNARVILSKLGPAPARAVSAQDDREMRVIRMKSGSTNGKKSLPGGRTGGEGAAEALKGDWVTVASALACCCLGCCCGWCCCCFSCSPMSFALAVKYSSSVLNCTLTGGNCEKFCGFSAMKFSTYLHTLISCPRQVCGSSTKHDLRTRLHRMTDLRCAIGSRSPWA